MPKIDTIRRIDNRSNGKTHAAPAGAIYSSDGMADTLDGYDASKAPGPNLIPVSRADGTLDPGWLPEQAMSGEGASPIGGQVYVAPWVRLAKAISNTDSTLLLTGPAFAVGDHGILAHYLYGNEAITITGGPVQLGGLYEYTVERAATTRAYPAGTTAVFNLGGADGRGGFITFVSGDQQMSLNPPHINLFAWEDGEAVRKMRIGLLSGLSAGEKALFPAVTDWNRYSLYADDAFLKGQINATSGNITGDLDVSGTLGVWSGLGRAGTIFGNTEAGYGMMLRDSQGEPLFWAVSPYRDGDQVLSEVAVGIKAEGRRLLYLHKDTATDDYKLEIGVETLVDGLLRAPNILAGSGTYPDAFTGTRLGSEGIYAYGTSFLPEIEIPTDDPRLYFGLREGWLGHEGMTIDTRRYDTEKALLEHAVRWIHPTTRPSAPTENIGAALGSGTSTASGKSFVFMHTERSLWDLGIPTAAADDYARAGLMAFAGGTSTFYGQVLNLQADSRLFVQVGDGQASVFERDRVTLPALSVAGQLVHSTGDGLTVGMGTDASGSAARLVLAQDDRPVLRAQRDDQFLTLYLGEYVPQGQQSALPGGYVMRANSTIGISTYANASDDYNAVQDWLHDHGLQPYTPQLGELANQNIATQYDDVTVGLTWAQAAVDEVKRFPHPMIFDYGEYWYKTSPTALTWTIGGSPVTQDAMTLGELTTVLTNTRAWFQAVGITNPWMLIDEPPHGTAPDWTIDIENRVIKFTAAAVAAGFKVGVAVPGPTQLAYWRSRLSPTRWILAAKHERNEYATNLPAGEIWLYNRTNKAAGKPMAGLAQQMRDFGATGYLHWSANSDVGTWPLVTCAGSPLEVTATLYGDQLLEELRLFAETDVPPVQPVYEQWLTTSGTLILNARSGRVTRPANFPVALGSTERPWSHVYAQHLHGALGSQVALTSGSSMYISAYSPVLAVGLETANILAYFEESDIPVGKFLRATDAESDSWETIKVLSTGRAAGDWWEYDIERAAAGVAQYWPEGTVWADLGGNATDGYIRLWGADDLNPDTGPAIVVYQRDNDDAPNSVSERATFGNLNGFYGYEENVYGVAFGRYAGRWVALDDAEGLRIMDGSTQRAVYREYAQIGNPLENNVLITDSTLALRTGTTAYIEMDNAGDISLTGTMAVATGGAITWAGGKGTADETGIEHVEDANNYWEVKPNSYSLVYVKSAGATARTSALFVENGANINYGLYVSSATSAIYTTSDIAFGSVVIIDSSGASSDAIAATSIGANGRGVRGVATAAGGVGVEAVAVAPATTALLVTGGIVDGGSQRYTNLANATADTDAVNRQTADARYAPIGSSSQTWRTWFGA